MKKIKINQFNIHQYIPNPMNIYILLILIIKIQTIEFFNAIPTINNQNYIITEDKIIYYNNNNNIYDTKFEFDNDQMIQSDEEYETICYGRFNQELESDQGHLLIIKGYIYSITDTGNVSLFRKLSGMSNELSHIIPIKILDQVSYFIYATLNNNYLTLILYKGKDQIMKFAPFNEIKIGSKSISCHYKTNLICFYENTSDKIVSSIFNVSIINQNNADIKYISSYYEQNGGAEIIKSIYSSKLNKYIVCYIKNNNICGCMTYNSKINQWEYLADYLTKCINKKYSLNIQYFDGFNFYILSCFQAEKQFSFIKLNNNFEILDKKKNNSYLLNEDLIKDCSSFSLGSFVNDTNSAYYPVKIFGICNSEIKKYEVEKVSIPTTILETTINKAPTTIIATTINKIPTTTIPTTILLTTMKKIITKIPTTILLTTITKIITTIPTTILGTTINKIPTTTIPTTILLTTMKKIITTIPNTILGTTINKVPTIPTTILTTIINKAPSTIQNFISTAIKKINPSIKIYTTILKSNQYKTSTIIQTDIFTTISNAYGDIDSFYLLFENNEISKDNILDKLRYELRVGKLDKLIDNIIIKDKKNIIYRDNNLTYELSSTDIKNMDNNISSINLGKCENKLKINNSININDSLLILKVDIYGIGLLMPIIEYEVYNIKTKEKLNLSICKNDKIEISIPVKIDENNLYKHNISDDYYNNICSVKDSNIDIILNDRRNEFFINNMSVCEKDCVFKDYNFESKKVLCECFIKINFPLLSKIDINKNLLMNNFMNISNIMNLDVMKCYEVLFTKEGLVKNIGNYILISIILINIILLLLFIIKGFKKIKVQIENIIKNKNMNKRNDNKNKNKNKKYNIKNDNKKYDNSNKNKNNSKKKGNNGINTNKKYNKKNDNKKSNIKNDNKKFKKKKNNPPKKNNSINKNKKKNIIIKNINHFETMNDNSKIKFTNNIKKNKNFELSKLNHINQIMKYNDNELNMLNYKVALLIDKRNYNSYYFSLLKTKHILLFTFFNNNDYNSKAIKIYLFLFTFASFLIINTLFFNDSTMHKIYEYNGNYNFIEQIPIILYSSIISSIINIIIRYLSLSENDILEIKYEINNIIKKSEIILKCLIIKFASFFILTFILLILFWYYISCFCVIYKNTQIHLIKDTLISYSVSLIYPLIIYLLPGIFRIPSLRAKNKDKECMYKLSKYIQLI